MALQSLKWTGPAVTEKLRAAQIAGVNRTMGACVKHAKDNHPWQNRSTVLEGSIDVVDYAAEVAEGVKGSWGSRDVEYALAHELGATIEHPGGTAYMIGDDGKAVFVSNDSPAAAELPRTKPHQIVLPARPYLRPAADELYPTLAENIRKAHNKKAPAPSTGSGGGSDGR